MTLSDLEWRFHGSRAIFEVAQLLVVVQMSTRWVHPQVSLGWVKFFLFSMSWVGLTSDGLGWTRLKKME